MFRRLLTAAAVVVLALTVLAWPVSRLGAGVVVTGPGVERSAWVANGALRLDRRDLPPPKPLERERYDVRVGRPAGQAAVVVPLWTLLLGSGAAVGLIAGGAWRRARARRERGRCPACGHPRPGPEGPCHECGLAPAEAWARAWSRPAERAVRDGGVGLFLAMVAISTSIWMVVRADERADAAHRARALDYSWYLEACTPQLTGDVIYALPGPGPVSLSSALQIATPGTTIVLLPGHHDAGDLRMTPARALKGLWILGSGRDATSLTMQYAQTDAVRIQGVTVECADSPVCEIRDGGSLHLRDCVVRGYNSGAGGSDAVFASGAALLIESCEFEGKSGRAAATMRGNALDLRGENRVFIRESRFVDNQSVFREADGVLDRCASVTDQPQFFIGPGGAGLYARESALSSGRTWGPAATPCSQVLDDPAALRRLAGGAGVDGAWEDPVVRAAARRLRLGRGTAHWGRLLLHPDPAVRALAQGRVGLPAADEPGMALEAAAGSLGEPILKRGAVLAILGAGEAGRARLGALLRSGAEAERSAAAALLRVMEAQPPLPEVVRARAYRR